MSSGATHFKVSIVLDCIAIPTAFVLADPNIAIGVAVGLVTGTFATPDVRDMQGKRLYPVYILSKVPLIGGFLAYALRVSFYPLALALPHRSRLSHALGLGTVVAIAYLFAISCVVLMIVAGPVTFPEVSTFLIEALISPAGIAFFFGFLVQDLSHIAFDTF